MCTLALYLNCFADLPIVVAANRDEHFDRPSAPPSLLDGTPKLIAGQDLRAGGTWLGVNEFGLVVGILNRRITGEPLSPAESRSRGLLCRDLLKFRAADQALKFFRRHEFRYNPFTVVVADSHSACVTFNKDNLFVSQELATGLHVFSSAAEVDLHSAKAERAHQRFASVREFVNGNGAGSSELVGPLANVLADHSLANGSDDPGDAICVHRETSGTVSASLIFYSSAANEFQTFHTVGAPCRNSFDLQLRLVTR